MSKTRNHVSVVEYDIFNWFPFEINMSVINFVNPSGRVMITFINIAIGYVGAQNIVIQIDSHQSWSVD